MIKKHEQQQQNSPFIVLAEIQSLDAETYSEDSPKTSRSSEVYSIESEALMTLDGLKGYLI